MPGVFLLGTWDILEDVFGITRGGFKVAVAAGIMGGGFMVAMLIDEIDDDNYVSTIDAGVLVPVDEGVICVWVNDTVVVGGSVLCRGTCDVDAIGAEDIEYLMQFKEV